jgi:phosphoribosylcarboxyaminoimidazole (NCAIR) mutase
MAAQILALADEALALRLAEWRRQRTESVADAPKDDA